jgi:hypothetical protein
MQPLFHDIDINHKIHYHDCHVSTLFYSETFLFLQHVTLSERRSLTADDNV